MISSKFKGCLEKLKSYKYGSFILIFSFLFLTIIISYPLIVGLVAKGKVIDILELAKEKSKEQASLSYELKRHYFSTDVLLTAKNINNNAGTEVVIKAKLVHWSLKMTSTVEFNDVFKNTFLKEAKNLPLIQFESSLSLSGGIKNYLNISPFDLESGTEGHKTAWKIFPMKAEFALNRKHNIDRFNVDLAGIDMKPSQGDLVHLENVNLTWNVDDGIRTYNSKVLLDAKLFNLGATSIGPLSFIMTLKDLDSNALEELKNVSSSLKNNPSNSSASKSPQQLQQELLGQLSQIVTRLLQHSPRLELKFNTFKTSLGDVVADAYLAVPKANLALGILSLITGVQSEVKMKVPQGIAALLMEQYIFWRDMKGKTDELNKSRNNKNTENLSAAEKAKLLPRFSDAEIAALKEESKRKVQVEIDQLVDKKYLVKENTDLSLHFQLQSGSMTLNGQAFSLNQH